MQQLISLGVECLEGIQSMAMQLSLEVSDLMRDSGSCAAASGCLFGLMFLCLLRLRNWAEVPS